MSNDFWITVTFPNEDTENKLDKTLQNCQIIHKWATEYFFDYWLKNKELPHASSISGNITVYISRLPMRHETQRFTLNKAVERALRHFKSDLVTTEKGIEYKPSEVIPITDFQIATRLVWKKYMESYNQISTSYGPFYLEKEWRDILDMQAKELNVPAEYLSHLWYSTTIKKDEGWKIKFNTHAAMSYQGKVVIKKIKKKK